MEKATWSFREFADFYGISVVTARKLGREKGFPVFRQAKNSRISVEAAKRWMEAKMAAAND